MASDHLAKSFFDVNGDSRLTAIDVLQIINQLTRETAEAEQVALPSESTQEATTDVAVDQYAAAEDLDRADPLVASFGQIAPPAAFDSAFDDDSEDVGAEGDVLESTLALLASDSGR